MYEKVLHAHSTEKEEYQILLSLNGHIRDLELINSKSIQSTTSQTDCNINEKLRF